MKLYVAITYLDEKEWRVGTGYTACMGGAEIWLRRFLRKEVTRNGMFGGHVSLYFEDATERMIQGNAKLSTPEAVGSKNFSVDVLENDPHSVNLLGGCEGWYNKWQKAIVKLYRVDASDAQIEKIHDEALKPLRNNTPYSMAVNLNSLLPCFCFPCFYLWPLNWFRERGVNCVGHVLKSLRVGLGRELVTKRVLAGARLPAELLEELVESGEIKFARDLILTQSEKACETSGLLLPPLYL